MIVHPRCPCSRASVGELSRLMTRLGDRVKGYVLVVQPEGTDGDEWSKSELADSAARINGIEVQLDRGGREAKLFGAATSGQTYLYSRTGALQFSGGITASRGHYGDSQGSSEIARLTLEGEGATAETAASSNVYGCELHDTKKKEE